MPLLRSRRLLPLLVTQTLGAVNDNLFKNALVVLILFRSAGRRPGAGGAGRRRVHPALRAAVGHRRADRRPLREVAHHRAGQGVGAGADGAGGAGFLLGSTPLLFGVLFGLGVQATFFSPLKYGILPQHLAEHELVGGNGLIEAGTFLGILAGTIAGGALFGLDHGPVIVSVAGLRWPPAGVAAPR